MLLVLYSLRKNALDNTMINYFSKLISKLIAKDVLKMYDRKPNCSYNCLIGMALKSSDSGRLPVGEIYRFFE